MNQPVTDVSNSPRFKGGILRRPVFWLAIQSLAVALLAATTGGLAPRTEPDTASFLRASRAESVPQALANIRTPGYPLLLGALEQPGRGRSARYARVPAVQLLVYLAAVWLFWVGLSRFTAAPWLALAASSPLLWGQPLTLARSLLPDFLAMAFVIASVGALFLLVVRPGRWLWVAMATTLFAGYLLRPAVVFVIALVPVLAVVLRRLHSRASWLKAIRFGAVAAVVAVGPYLGFAALRWVTVGHFGLVSFGGYNAAGMAMLFLDETAVRDLPPEQQALAKRLYRNRERRGWGAVDSTDDLFAVIHEQYSVNIFHIGMPIARRLIIEELKAGEGDLNPRGLDRPDFLAIEANRRLNALARSIVLLRPANYLRWIRNSLTHGLAKVGDVALIRWPFFLLIVSLPVAFLRRGPGGGFVAAESSRRGRALAGLAVLALGYFAAYLLLVALVSYPFPRYFVSISLFMPSLLMALLFESWRVIFQPFQGDGAARLGSAS